ncbi:MAG TPA: hemolytic protein HlpA-like protein [Deltaproteobacteria bacterium]|nr:hemolytic protein HlpA-like protein [Deltaproteobacteria bacterium]
MSTKTPVAFLIFNRPDTTARVFAEIRRARPSRLLVVADGPRTDRKGEEELIAATRAIIDRVDWPCEVLKNYSDVNLGCKRRVSSGIDWVFNTVEEAIILEDDCLPDPSFFSFCEELLARYRNDDQICQICGVNFQFGNNITEYSYYFSRYCHIWGWASWRRAWQGYDVEMKSWKGMHKRRELADILSQKEIVDYWASIFDLVYRGKIDTWDYQWTFHNMIRKRFSIIPNVNLISNIGFTVGATHTTGQSRFNNMKREHMNFPLKHPPDVRCNSAADRFTETEHYMIRLNAGFVGKIFNTLRHIKSAV